jgi:hypothetical protein
MACNIIGYTALTQKEPKMVRYNIEEKEYTWKKKRRRSADTGKSKDRRQKVVDGIIIQDYERRLESEASYDSDENRCGEDRRKGKNRRK